MELKKPSEVLHLSTGDVVTKRNLFDLIQYSKDAESQYWGGEGNQIGNTPQQGINWLGKPPHCQAVLIKTRPGFYQDDGWKNPDKTVYHYSFKAAGDKISYSEKANAVLINQPQHGYPILLFTEIGNSWTYEGDFAVSEIAERYVVLERGYRAAHSEERPNEDPEYKEGGRRYVTHLMAERNRAVVAKLKESSDSVCDLCKIRFAEKYGVEYIEAHHKTPISTYSSSHAVKLEDFALLCPNCHKAVHIYMRDQGLDYQQINERLCGRDAQ